MMELQIKLQRWGTSDVYECNRGVGGLISGKLCMHLNDGPFRFDENRSKIFLIINIKISYFSTRDSRSGDTIWE